MLRAAYTRTLRFIVSSRRSGDGSATRTSGWLTPDGEVRVNGGYRTIFKLADCVTERFGSRRVGAPPAPGGRRAQPFRRDAERIRVPPARGLDHGAYPR